MKKLHYTQLTGSPRWSLPQRSAVRALATMLDREENVLHSPCMPARQVALSWLYNAFDVQCADQIVYEINSHYEWGPSMALNPDDHEI